jgi:K+-sensing histidine kinase KdpD
VNLLDNAIKYTPDGETIDIRLSEDARSVRTEVSNPGPRIALEEQRHIFEAYPQGVRSDAAPPPTFTVTLPLTRGAVAG